MCYNGYDQRVRALEKSRRIFSPRLSGVMLRIALAGISSKGVRDGCSHTFMNNNP